MSISKTAMDLVAEAAQRGGRAMRPFDVTRGRSVSMSDTEWEAVCDLARADGQKISAWVRAQLLYDQHR